MTQKKDLLKNIAEDFIYSTIQDTVIDTAVITYEYGFKLKDPKYHNALKNKMIETLKCNATYCVSENVFVFVLQSTLNKEKKFDKTLYIKMASGYAASALVNATIKKQIDYKGLIISPLTTSLLVGVSTVVDKWDEGGQRYIKTMFPAVYNAASNNEFIKQVGNQLKEFRNKSQ